MLNSHCLSVESECPAPLKVPGIGSCFFLGLKVLTVSFGTFPQKTQLNSLSNFSPFIVFSEKCITYAKIELDL